MTIIFHSTPKILFERELTKTANRKHIFIQSLESYLLTKDINVSRRITIK